MKKLWQSAARRGFIIPGDDLQFNSLGWGMGHQKLPDQGIPDAFGVPSYFVTTFFCEPAGPGLVRLYGCAELGGTMVTQYIAVIPVESVFKGTQMVRDMATSVIHEDAAVH